MNHNLNHSLAPTRSIRVALRCILLIWLGVVALTLPVEAQTDEATLDDLFAELADPELQDWELVEDKIWSEWSKSGSRSLDLLLERGRDAMARGDFEAAVDHLSALIDHAPEFAEGWNARATTFYMMDEYGLSVSDIRQTLIRNPRHFGAMAGLGQILEQTGRAKEALTVYTRALELHPHQASIQDAVTRLEQQVGGSTL